MRGSPSFFASLALAASVVSSVVAEVPKPVFQMQEIDKIQIGYGVVIGDVDGDKQPDILLADKTQIVWYANPGKAGEAWKKHVMADKLTPLDNVCIAARDIDGDGKVEVAVGAMWNPGETNDDTKSGSVFYLIRPADPTQKWEPVKLHHEVTTHRMQWVQLEKGRFVLVVKPLHGKGNKNGQGAGCRVLAYEPPADLKSPWKTTLIDDTMHMTHNFDVVPHPEVKDSEMVILAGREGFKAARWEAQKWVVKAAPFADQSEGVGEVRMIIRSGRARIAAVEPMHGNKVVAYIESGPDQARRAVLDDTLKEGHALVFTDLLGIGSPQVLVGWRSPNKDVKVGIKMFIPDDDFENWQQVLIDDNKVAVEDMKVADLDGDGKPEIVAAGRATKNLNIYWNKTGK